MTMWNLAIECSGQSASIALCGRKTLELTAESQTTGSSTDHLCLSDIDDWLYQSSLSDGESTVQFLAPRIAKVLSDGGIRQPSFLSVTVGPGSFTGLRVGLATAKLLAMAWRIPVAAVDSLEAICCYAAESNMLKGVSAVIIPSINAYRRQVFSGVWTCSNGQLNLVRPSEVVDATHWQSDPLASMGLDVSARDRLPGVRFVAGPGVVAYPLASKKTVRMLEGHAGVPPARVVAELGWQAWRRNDLHTAEGLSANYVRSSAAEEVEKAQKS